MEKAENNTFDNQHQLEVNQNHIQVDTEMNTVKPILRKGTRYPTNLERPRSLSSNLWKLLNPEFDSATLESLYRRYFSNQKYSSLLRLIALAVVLNVGILIIYSIGFKNGNKMHVTRLVLSSIFSFLNAVLFGLYGCNIIHKGPSRRLPYITWIILFMQLILDLSLGYEPLTPLDSLGIFLFFIYVTYTMLPFQLYSSLALCIVIMVMHTGIVAVFSDKKDNMGQQMASNILLLTCANIIGLIDFVVTDVNQRKAFMDTRESLQIKISFEQQTKEQKRLLLSVLPPHLAAKIIKDMRQDGTILGGAAGFKKIYIERHESCSILFADIVGFTEYSSTVTAEELIIMLNELFANFDKLAKKYICERIKILGDCYYCIAGIEVNRGDKHAINSVEMGLGMVEHIKKVREQTKVSCLDMRVGIHTGSVLAGIIGQRKWQFDVWSNDVTLANRMESGGIPGRVHVSDATYLIIKDEYICEDGEGEKRNDYLKENKIATYLIISRNTNKNEVVTEEGGVEIEPRKISTPQRRFSRIVTLARVSSAVLKRSSLVDIQKEVASETVITVDETTAGPLLTKQRSPDQEQLDKMLYEALEQPQSKFREKVHRTTLHFKDKDIERQYYQEEKLYCILSLSCPFIVVIFSFFVELVILPQSLRHYLTFSISCSLLAVFILLMLIEKYKKYFPSFMVKVSDTMNHAIPMRNIIASLSVLLAVCAELIDMTSCEKGGTASLSPKAPYCHYSLYFSHIGLLILIATSAVIQLNFVFKIVLMLLTIIAYCILQLLIKPFIFIHYDAVIHKTSAILIPKQYFASALLIFCFIILLWHSRQVEYTSRRLLLWKKEAQGEKDEIQLIRGRNEQLMRNILPLHVIDHFLKSQNQDEAELYSKSYSNVGVIFASIPTFSDFYSEESFNKGGIECMRFLNEVISDFDEVLSEPRFRYIEKIKTVNSTYMAASGLSDIEDTSVSDSTKHLVALADFSLALKEKLNSLNAESFNNFELRIGLSHGPVVAGVIGAKKPHYDIWGNTVNIASRMETTGKPGTIQVLKDTYDVLKTKGYQFEPRGYVNVKGKGKLLVYLLIKKM